MRCPVCGILLDVSDCDGFRVITCPNCGSDIDMEYELVV